MINKSIKSTEIVNAAQNHLETMLKSFYKSSEDIYELISSILIFPPDYTGSYVNIDLPTTSRIVQQHNDFLSTEKLNFQLSLARLDHNLYLSLEYYCTPRQGYIEFQDDYCFEVTYFNGQWLAERQFDS